MSLPIANEGESITASNWNLLVSGIKFHALSSLASHNSGLVWNNTSQEWKPKAFSPYLSESDLTAVLDDNYYPSSAGNSLNSSYTGHSSNTSIHFTKTSISIEDLSDVDVMAPSDGEVLTWNATLSKWSSQAIVEYNLLSTLTIDTDKDWLSYGIHNLSYLSSQTISGGSIQGDWVGNSIAQSYLKSGSQYWTGYTHSTDSTIHLTSVQKTDLTDGGDSTLHYHSTDRDLSNATGVLAIANGGTNHTSFTTSKFLIYDGTRISSSAYDNTSFASATHTHSIEDLSDVASMTPSDGEVLTWDATLGMWSSQTGGIESLSQLTIDTDKNWGSYGINNLGFISSQKISGGSIIGDWVGNAIEQSYLASGTEYWSAYSHSTDSTIHLTSVQKTDLTDGGDSTLHYHSADRSLANATGILGIANGGTNHDTFTTNNFLIYDGTRISSSSYDETSFAAASHTHAASDVTTGTLAHERGGLEADVSAYNGLVKIAGGSTSYITDSSSDWDTAYTHSQTTTGNPHSISVDDLTDTSLGTPNNGEILYYDGSSWVDVMPPMTFNVANVMISANQNINVARFSIPAGKTLKLLQAAAADTDGTSVNDLKIQLLNGTSVVYSTSSASLQQGNPLASIDGAANIEIRFAYSGASVTGIKYGSAFMNVIVV